jgi:hypothetical protein
LQTPEKYTDIVTLFAKAALVVVNNLNAEEKNEKARKNFLDRLIFN